MLCFHGTTKSGLKNILNDIDKGRSIWNCSEYDENLYFWPLSKADDNLVDNCINSAFESAKAQSLSNNDTDLYVIQCEIPNEMLYDDYSCRNMSDSASYISFDEFNIDMITGIYHLKINKWIKPLLLAIYLNNDEFNIEVIDKNLLNVAKLLENKDFGIDEIFENNYKKINLNIIKKLKK